MKMNPQNILKYVPMVAVLYAAYTYYADRGMDGIIADLNAITIDGIKGKFSQILTGVAAFFIADIVAKEISNRYAKTAIKTVGYYFGAGQLFAALRSGAGYGRTRARGFIPATNTGIRG
jgi:hypothetical protein